MDRCWALLDDGHKCTRNAKRLNGLCGFCHGITSEHKRCTQPITKNKRGKYCGRKHKTREEIESYREARANKRRRPPRNSAESSNDRSPQGRETELTDAVKREIATFCANAILNEGVLAAFDSQIADYVSEKIVDEITRKWDGKNCDEIAKIARGLLAIRGHFQKLLRVILNWIMVKLGYRDLARLFACQLISAVPLMWYTKVVAAARILQISGICLCMRNDRDLKDCKCLHDLVIFEGKEAVGRLMAAAIHDWREMAERVPYTLNKKETKPS
jgi:hypothetical protein